jgi:hypothetical protein
MGVIKDLAAHLNMKTEPYTLTVTGAVELVDPNASVSVAEAVPQGIDAATLVLNVTASPSGGKGAFVPFHFEKRVRDKQWDRVTVHFDGAMQTVDVETLG